MAKTKLSRKEQKAAVNEAFNFGYQSGWEDRDKIVDSVRTKAALKVGYGRGVRDNSRVKKYQGKYNDAKATNNTVLQDTRKERRKSPVRG